MSGIIITIVVRKKYSDLILITCWFNFNFTSLGVGSAAQPSKKWWLFYLENTKAAA